MDYRIVIDFDGEAFEKETGRPLTPGAMQINGERINETARFLCGCEGWRVEEKP
jgi:hypothetical protein